MSKIVRTCKGGFVAGAIPNNLVDGCCGGSSSSGDCCGEPLAKDAESSAGSGCCGERPAGSAAAPSSCCG